MRILIERAIAVVVDVQERLLPHIFNREDLTRNLVTLIRGLKVLSVPVLATEQYPKGLGATVPEIRSEIDSPPVTKIAFSCLEEPSFARDLAGSGRTTVLLAGIEAHVCVLQSAVDLLAAGYEPVVVYDCVSSRKEQDLRIARDRLAHEGVAVTSYESLLLELCRRAGTDTFRAISRLIK